MTVVEALVDAVVEADEVIDDVAEEVQLALTVLVALDDWEDVPLVVPEDVCEVDAEVVAVEEPDCETVDDGVPDWVDVCVDDGDVTSQFLNVPSMVPSMMRLSELAK